jgi:uncharacterized protein (TIGR01777 family)
VRTLENEGHQVTRIVRSGGAGHDISWDIGAGTIDAARLEGLDAVVHLAGAPLGERRWNEEVKAEIQDSRIDGTRLLCSALAGLEHRPSVLVSASAIGYYGDRGAEVLDESSVPGRGFLAELCQAWEAATAEAEAAGIRVVHLRTGLVIGQGGGALARMLPFARLGLGGRLGSGRQYMSWVAISDEVGAIVHALSNVSVAGALNATDPQPVTNSAYTAVLSKVLRRPAQLPVPEIAIAAAFGKEMASEMILASQRVMPTRLIDTHYEFQELTLEGALPRAVQ